MLCWITILGGVLIMMGQHSRSEALFYYFRLEDQVPETHLLRLIEKHISLAFVREKLKESYSDTGRPSIDPELLLRILLIGYLYGITSERKLVEELRMHLAWRWFTGLGFDQEIPHHSTFSTRNRLAVLLSRTNPHVLPLGAGNSGSPMTEANSSRSHVDPWLAGLELRRRSFAYERPVHLP